MRYLVKARVRPGQETEKLEEKLQSQGESFLATLRAASSYSCSGSCS